MMPGPAGPVAANSATVLAPASSEVFRRRFAAVSEDTGYEAVRSAPRGAPFAAPPAGPVSAHSE